MDSSTARRPSSGRGTDPPGIPSPQHHKYHIPDEDMDPLDPFYSLLINDPSLPRRPRNVERSRYWYNPWAHEQAMANLDELKMRLRGQQHARGSVVVVQGINDDVVSVIKDTFPDPDLLAFLHQHTARSEYPQSSLNDTELEHINQELHWSPREGAATSCYGSHFDGICLPVPNAGMNNGGESAFSFALTKQLTSHQNYRTELFTKSGSRGTAPKWNRTSTRISCCMLRDGLYLVLLDAPICAFGIPDTRLDDPRPMTVQPDRKLRLFDPYKVLRRAFANLAHRDVVEFMGNTSEQVTQRNSVFHALLTVSEWQTIVAQREKDMRHLQSRALEEGTLQDLGEFRRTLAYLRGSMAGVGAKLSLAAGMAPLRRVDGKLSHNSQVINVNNGGAVTIQGGLNITGSAEEGISALSLIDKLTQLEAILGNVARTANEEIQLFMALISTRDSEVMREDSRIMKQQAARTTLLTTLAVVYLPLQLITGIFGMNIKEITQDARLRWSACLVALGVCGLFTVLVYLIVRRVRRRRDNVQTKGKVEENKGV